MKLSQLKEFIKTVVREEQDYEQLFKTMLAKTGKSIPDMSDDEKKKFFNDVDDSYKAKSESKLRRYRNSVNESDMDAKLPKDLLIQVVEALIIQVITQASSRKINIPASDIESLRNTLKKEINSGKITSVGQIMKTIKTLHPMREGIVRGYGKSVNEGKIQPKDDWGVRLVRAINNNVKGLHASVIREKRDVKESVEAFGTVLKNAIKETLKHKYKPHPKAKDADNKIKTFISELKKFENIVDMVIAKPTKIGVTKLDDAWRSVWNYKYAAEIALAGDLYDSIIESKIGKVNEAAFRTLFTHSIWKKRGVNYVDSNFVNDCKGKIPLSDLVHVGMGDFVLKTPHGDIEFDRVSETFDGMSGRAHRMTGNKELMDMLFKKMKARVVHSESVNRSIKTRINEWSSNDVLALLGGKRFLATSGAYSMSGNVAEKTAKFHFKTPGKNGINNVWITETSPDKYTINFIKTDGEDIKVAPVKNISGDNLKSVFTKHTGLKTP
jgi:hypothetical protein